MYLSYLLPMTLLLDTGYVMRCHLRTERVHLARTFEHAGILGNVAFEQGPLAQGTHILES